MAKKQNLVESLRQQKSNPQQQKKVKTLDDIIHFRKELDVNEELLEGNPDIDSVLQRTTHVLNNDGERSGTRFVVPPYEKQIKDKRFKSTQVHNNKLDN